MGKIRATYIKRTAEKIYRDYKDQVNGDFLNNKLLVENLGITDKNLRNRIAGYVTRCYTRPVHVSPPKRQKKFTSRDRRRAKKRKKKRKRRK